MRADDEISRVQRAGGQVLQQQGLVIVQPQQGTLPCVTAVEITSDAELILQNCLRSMVSRLVLKSEIVCSTASVFDGLEGSNTNWSWPPLPVSRSPRAVAKMTSSPVAPAS